MAHQSAFSFIWPLVQKSKYIDNVIAETKARKNELIFFVIYVNLVKHLSVEVEKIL